jgi:hypothetical protein
MISNSFFIFRILIFALLSTESLVAQITNPYSIDGFYSLNGSIDLPNRSLQDKNGQQIGAPGFDWMNFDNSFFVNSKPFSGIVYKVENQKLASVGEVFNGKKNGLWIECITDLANEHVNCISSVFEYKNGVLVKKKEKGLNYEDTNCYEQGFFDFSAPNQSEGILTDPNGIPSTHEEFDGYGKPLYSLNKKVFNGIGYVNESGACYVIIANYTNGFTQGLFINSNEGGYVSSFGLMSAGSQTGRWIINQYTGEPNKILDYQDNQITGRALFFQEGKLSGIGNYKFGELLDCEGVCEE